MGLYAEEHDLLDLRHLLKGGVHLGDQQAEESLWEPQSCDNNRGTCGIMQRANQFPACFIFMLDC